MIEPVQIIEDSTKHLTINWSDDAVTEYDASDLRRSCPCAACINEWTGEKILKDTDVDENIEFSTISIVGRYALNFHFSDGHDTGIFSFNYLRKISDK
jgi:DUF971 family protein